MDDKDLKISKLEEENAKLRRELHALNTYLTEYAQFAHRTKYGGVTIESCMIHGTVEAMEEYFKNIMNRMNR
jgi:hypothetical protein